MEGTPLSFMGYFRKKEDHTKRTLDLSEELINTLCQNMETEEEIESDDKEANLKFAEYLKTRIKQHAAKLDSETDRQRKVTTVDAEAIFYFSDDKMTVRMCLLPPLGGGKDADLVKVTEDLRYEGLTYGLDEEALFSTVKEKDYLRIKVIARGKLKKDGKDAQIFNLFKDLENFHVEAEEGAVIDFADKNLVQTVHKGEIICRMEPATQSEGGIDVTGRMIEGIDGLPSRLPQGENTVISQDGLLLRAGIDGMLFTRGGLFCVERYMVFSDTDHMAKTLDCPGGVIIEGNVNGSSIKAKGNIFIEGSIQNARLTAGGSVRIQKGMQGAVVQAGGQFQCKTMEDMTVVAGGSIFAETIIDCNVTCDSSIYVKGGRGLLAGGQIKLRGRLEAKRIGNQSGRLSIIILNYKPELKESIWTTKDLIKNEQSILDDLKKHLNIFHGKSSKLSSEEKEIQKQLEEQWVLHEAQYAKLSDILKQMDQEEKTTDSYVVSEEILPPTIVRLGEKAMMINKERHEHCRIFLDGNALKITSKSK